MIFICLARAKSQNYLKINSKREYDSLKKKKTKYLGKEKNNTTCAELCVIHTPIYTTHLFGTKLSNFSHHISSRSVCLFASRILIDWVLLTTVLLKEISWFLLLPCSTSQTYIPVGKTE